MIWEERTLRYILGLRSQGELSLWSGRFGMHFKERAALELAQVLVCESEPYGAVVSMEDVEVRTLRVDNHRGMEILGARWAPKDRPALLQNGPGRGKVLAVPPPLVGRVPDSLRLYGSRGVFDWSAEPSRDISPRVFVYQVTGWDEQTRTWVMTCADGEG